MIATRKIETAPGIVFDASVAGPGTSPLVLLLHGLGVSRFFRDAQLPTLADAGNFAVAPNQRGYTAGARPDPTDLGDYRVDRLIADVFGVIGALGHAGRRFHLAGRDWGASLAWQIADERPERPGSLTILSQPHPLSFARALALPDVEQKRRSRHHTTFLEPGPVADTAERERRSAVGYRETCRRHKAMRTPGKRRSCGIGRVACITGRSRLQRSRRCIAGATTTIRLEGRPPREPASAAPYADRVPRQVNALLLKRLDEHPV